MLPIGCGKTANELGWINSSKQIPAAQLRHIKECDLCREATVKLRRQIEDRLRKSPTFLNKVAAMFAEDSL
jgi:hypothetical protein